MISFVPLFLKAQSSDLVSKCRASAGPNVVYLKDIPIKLGKDTPQPELRWKEQFQLNKNYKYRFTLCSEGSTDCQLIMKIKDSQGKYQGSNFDIKTGKIYPTGKNGFDFTCTSSGKYLLYFDFLDFKPGEGIFVLSVLK